jgi:beta-fructofuranosidase
MGMNRVPSPRLHFAPRAGRIGEIFGVLRDGGGYRLFYSLPGGELGQAVSDDLVIWWERPFTDLLGDVGCGSVAPGPVLFFTRTPGVIVRAAAVSGSPGWATDQVLGLAPDLRDPSVWWAGDEWRMLLAGEGRIVQYRSADLLTWEFTSELVAWTDARCPQLVPVDGAWALLVAGSYAVGDYDGRRFTPRHRGVFGRGRLERVVTFADAAGRRCAIARLSETLSLPWILSIRGDRLVATPHPHLDPYLTSGGTGLTATGGEVRDNGELILRMPSGGETLVLADADIVEVTVEGVSGLGAARRSLPGFSGLRIARLA